MWRKTTPKGLKLKRFIEGPDGTLVHDSSYVGENAWDEDLETTEGSLKKIIDRNARIQTEAKKKLSQDLGVSGQYTFIKMETSNLQQILSWVVANSYNMGIALLLILSSLFLEYMIR